MEFRYVAFDRLGARRGVLPNPLEAVPVMTLNDLGTLTLSYDRMSPNHLFLDNDPEVALERYDGNAWVEIPNARFRCLSVDFDHLNDTPVRSYTFIHIGEALSGVTVYSAYGKKLSDSGAVQWGLTNSGAVVSDIWNNAVTRDWKGFTKSFNGVTDSAGVAWGQSMNLAFDPETTLSGVLHRIVALGLADYQWTGRTLNLYKADGFLARDLTVGANPVSIVGTGKSSGVDSAPEQTDSSNLATHVIVIGEKGKRWVFETGYIAPEGRREILMSYSGVDDEGTARLLANPTILKATNELKNTTRQFHLTNDTTVLPFVTYQVGDRVWVQRGLVRERMRIRVVSLQMDSNGVQGFVTLGDKIDELLENMYEQVQRMNGGVTAAGTSTPSKPKGRTPGQPQSLIVSADPYIDKFGRTQGVVSINFTHVQSDVNGEGVQIDYYPVWYRVTGTNAWSSLLRIPSEDRTGTFSPLPAYDKFNVSASYDFMIAAVSTEGVQSATRQVIGVVVAQDSVPPPTPDFSQANVTTLYATNSVTWNGKGRSPSNVLVDMPADFAQVKVYQFSDAAGGGKVQVGTLAAAYAIFATDKVAPGTTRWYGLTAVDRTGNESEMSPLFSVTPQSLVDEQSIKDALTTVDQALTATENKAADAQTAADDAQTAAGTAQTAADKAIADALAAAGIANGKGKVLVQSNQPGVDDRNANTLWIDTTSGLNTPKRWVTGTQWQAVTDKVATDAAAAVIVAQTRADEAFNKAVDAATAAGNALTAANSKGRNWYQATKPAGTGHNVNDTWFQSPGNKVHRWNGNDWISIQDTDIAAAKQAADDAEAAGAAADVKAGNALQKATDAQGEVDALETKVASVEGNVTALTTSVNGKNKIVNSLSNATGTTGYVTGDRWQKWTTLAVGGKLLATWRFSTVWVPELIDPVYLPQVDIGAGTFGSLNGDRMIVGSIFADKVVIGTGGNLFPDPNFADAAGWASGTISDGTGMTGGRSILFPASTGQVGSYYGLNDAKRSMKISSDSAVRISVYVRTSKVALPGAIQVYVRYVKDSDNTWAFGVGSLVNSNTIPDNTWTQMSILVTAPAGAWDSVIVGLYVPATFNSAVRFSNLVVQQAATGELIVDGSITAAKIVAKSLTSASGIFGDIDANIINTGTLNAARLNAADVRAKFIQAGKVTAADMVTGTITAASGIIGEVDLGKATVGLLNGVRIEAGTILSKSMAIGDFTNLATIDAVRDVNVGGTETIGDYTYTRMGVQNYLFFKDRTDTVPFKGGDSLRVVFEATSSVDMTVSLNLWAYPEKTATGSATGNRGVSLSGISIPAGVSSHNYELKLTSALDGVFNSWTMGLSGPGGYNNADGIQGKIGVRNVRVYRMNGGEMIIDGSVTAGSLAANAVTAEKVEALAIETGKLAANAVTADKIDVGSIKAVILTAQSITGIMISGTAIDGKTITGATINGGVIQTVTAANTGVKINSGGLQAWDSNGRQTVLLDGSGVGNVITGTLRSAPLGESSVVIFSTTTNNRPGIWFTYNGGGGGEQAALLQGSDGSLNLRSRVDFAVGVQTALFQIWHRNGEDSTNSVMQVWPRAGGGGNIYLGALSNDLIQFRGKAQFNTEIESMVKNNFGGRTDIADLFMTSAPAATFGANVGIASSPLGRFYKVSSARRFKYAIDSVELDVAEKVLDVPARSWYDSGSTDAYADYVDGKDVELKDIPNLTRIPGVVAEEVEAAGLGMYCTYEADGTIQGVSYDRLWTLLIPLVKKLRNDNAELTTRIEALEP